MRDDVDTRSWSQVIEDDEYEQDKARFKQWLDEHPDPAQAMKRDVEAMKATLTHVREVLDREVRFLRAVRPNSFTIGQSLDSLSALLEKIEE